MQFFYLKFFILKILFTFAAQIKKEGTIAQLVEQRTENPCVPGSIPGGTTKTCNLSSYRSLCFLGILTS
jgi:hypothetical protein